MKWCNSECPANCTIHNDEINISNLDIEFWRNLMLGVSQPIDAESESMGMD